MNIRQLLSIAAVIVVVTGSVALAESDLVDGQVTKIDAAAGKITIKHGPLKKFGMDEGMTMMFRVAEPAMLKSVKAGDRIKFTPERVNDYFTVTKIEKIK